MCCAPGFTNKHLGSDRMEFDVSKYSIEYQIKQAMARQQPIAQLESESKPRMYVDAVMRAYDAGELTAQDLIELSRWGTSIRCAHHPEQPAIVTNWHGDGVALCAACVLDEVQP